MADAADGRAVAHPFRRDGLWLGVLWIVAGSVIGEFATHVRDYIDVDSIRYERLAISIARTHSLVPASTASTSIATRSSIRC